MDKGRSGFAAVEDELRDAIIEDMIAGNYICLCLNVSLVQKPRVVGRYRSNARQVIHVLYRQMHFSNKQTKSRQLF